MRIYVSLLTLMLAAMISTACERQGPFEEAGEKLDDTVEDVRNSVEDTCEDIKEGLDAEDTDC